MWLGAMDFGTKVPSEQSFALLDRWLELGGTRIDTADNYAFWAPGGTGDESETLLGRWLATRRARDRVVIATKVGARPQAGADTSGADFSAMEGLSGGAVREALTGSLRRLGLDGVDLLYAHVDDTATPVGETLAAFDALVGEGLARAVGASNLTPDRLAAALAASTAAGNTGYSTVQLRSTYVTPAPEADFGVQVALSDGHRELAADHGLTLTGYATQLAGAYTRTDRPVPPEYVHRATSAQLDAVRAVAGRTGATPAQVVLAWSLAGAVPVLPVLGVSRAEQLDEAVGALAVELSPADLTELAAARAQPA